MTNTREIIQSIGADIASELLGVGYKSLNRAAVENCFPAKWYGVIKPECERKGIDCPDELFNFIQPQSAPDADPAESNAA